MEPGEIIALAALVFTIFSFVAAAMIRSRDAQITELKHHNEVLRRTLEAKQETIDEQHRQLDRLMITAEIQERFFSGVSRNLPTPVKREDA